MIWWILLFKLNYSIGLSIHKESFFGVKGPFRPVNWLLANKNFHNLIGPDPAIVISFHEGTSVISLDSDWFSLSIFDKKSVNRFLLLVVPDLRIHFLLYFLWSNGRTESPVRKPCRFGAHKSNFWLMLPNFYVIHHYKLFGRFIANCNRVPGFFIYLLRSFFSFSLPFAFHQWFFFFRAQFHQPGLIYYMDRILILIRFGLLTFTSVSNVWWFRL